MSNEEIAKMEEEVARMRVRLNEMSDVINHFVVVPDNADYLGTFESNTYCVSKAAERLMHAVSRQRGKVIRQEP